MINKLRANYNLSKLLIRIAFVLAYVLYSWQDSFGVTSLMLGDLAGSTAYNLLVALMTSALLGLIIMLIVPIVSNVFLNYSRFYTVPRAEYGLLLMLFVSLYFAVCGVLKLINLITPLFLVWGDVLFPVIVSLGCVIWFYAVTAKLYFNNLTKPYYFRNVAIVYLVLVVVVEVIL